MATSSGKSDPVVLRISVADVVEALVRGLHDFQALPFFGGLFGALYAAGGVYRRVVAPVAAVAG